MAKQRLLFVKEEQAAYLSHLDLMRTFQRALPRGGVQLRHSQGFHPHPILSIVLPLPVGQSSECELLDFESVGEMPVDVEALNSGLPLGLRVLDCYEPLRPVRELYALQLRAELEYDAGVPSGAMEGLLALFAREELWIEKRTKRKQLAEVDLRPMLLKTELSEREGMLVLEAQVQAQNPGLNPALLMQAIERYCPRYLPDFMRIRRIALWDAEGKLFR